MGKSKVLLALGGNEAMGNSGDHWAFVGEPDDAEIARRPFLNRAMKMYPGPPKTARSHSDSGQPSHLIGLGTGGLGQAVIGYFREMRCSYTPVRAPEMTSHL